MIKEEKFMMVSGKRKTSIAKAKIIDGSGKVSREELIKVAESLKYFERE